MSHRSVFLILLIILTWLISCPKPEEADERAPIVAITSPVTGATVEDSVLIEVDASDNESVAKVEFWIDSVLVNTDLESPWEYLWDTNNYADGNQHSLQVKAYDPEGNVGSSAFVIVTILETITDIDGNVYRIVAIGDQLWMAENLKVTHYRDGTAIANVTDNAEWAALATGAYCIYNSEYEIVVDTYGNLYNWYAAKDSRNIAPEGWHVPTDDEWTALETYLSNNGHDGTEGSALKSTTGWEDGGNGTDDYGFTALPGAWRSYFDGYYNGMGWEAYFWSATKGSSSGAQYRYLNTESSEIRGGNTSKRFGFAIRCLAGPLPNAAPSATFTIDRLSGSTLTVFTFDASGCADVEDNSSQLQVRWDWESDGIWDTDYSTTKIIEHQFISAASYSVSMEVKDSGEATASETQTISITEATTVTDIDGNVYETIQIGDQEWMAENLKVTHYRDGTAITNVIDDADWAALTTEAYCIYNNNASNEVDRYGALYNWYATTDAHIIAPAGWHIPTDAEWTELENYLSNNGHNGTEGSALKSTTGWNFDGNGTDDYGFTALPGGYRDYVNGMYWTLGIYAYFWSATESSSGAAWHRTLVNIYPDLNRYSATSKRTGYAIRCVKD